jgi:hypothetical protein
MLWIKKGLLLLWAVWFSTAALTNIADGSKALALLPDEWAFASGNYVLIVEATKRYHTPHWLVATLFGFIIAWQTYAAWLFWRSFSHYAGVGSNERSPLEQAFAVSLALWGAFMIADELLIAYAIERTHRQLLGLELITLIFLQLVPDKASERDEV